MVKSEIRRQTGERLRRARLGAGFKSALAAAEHFGWQRWTYTAREQGARPMDQASAATYAKAFDVPTDYILHGDTRLRSDIKGWHPGEADRVETRLRIIYHAPIDILVAELEKFHGEGRTDPQTRLRLARRMADFKTATDAARFFGIPQSTYMAHENGQNRFGGRTAEAYGAAFSVNAAWLLGRSGPSGLPTTPDWGDQEWSRARDVTSAPFRPAKDAGRRGDPVAVLALLAPADDLARRDTSRDVDQPIVREKDGKGGFFVDLRLTVEAGTDGTAPTLRSCVIDEVEIGASWIEPGDLALVEAGHAGDGTGRLFVIERHGRNVLSDVEPGADGAAMCVGAVIRIVKRF